MRLDYGFVEEIIHFVLESDLPSFSLLLSDSLHVFIKILTRGSMLIAYLNTCFFLTDFMFGQSILGKIVLSANFWTLMPLRAENFWHPFLNAVSLGLNPGLRANNGIKQHLSTM